MIQFDSAAEQAAKIKVVGVGGAGGNAINGMIEAGLSGVEFIAVNTDAQDLEKNKSSNRLQIGKNITKGLGAGANPEIGLKAIEEDKELVIEALNGADMVFVTCGMGGGTGTGAAPIIAEIAKDMGALTVVITTMPFTFEGPIRQKNAKKGIEAIRERVDTMLVVPNDRIFTIIEKNTPVISAFKVVDSILLEATRSISDLINVHGYINLDFADIRTVMVGMGDALMGCGTGTGENRAIAAAEQAIVSPLLDGADISGARGVLINITGGTTLSMHEVGEASSLVQEVVGEGANVIWGMVIDEQLSEEVRVTVIATGFNREARQADQLQRPKEYIREGQYSITDFKELDKPTFKRENKSIDKDYPTGGRPNIFTLPEQEAPAGLDDLDIPAFLRKQMD
ncbi:MAG: cell division protein FtsZ [Calditrichales bacterium]|nr:cell division protein FtsZ [Calditrichales bacterium]